MISWLKGCCKNKKKKFVKNTTYKNQVSLSFQLLQKFSDRCRHTIKKNRNLLSGELLRPLKLSKPKKLCSNVLRMEKTKKEEGYMQWAGSC